MSCYALVDCNNFYSACQKLFRPDLAHKPVVCLSNNDGNIVARSAEAKALGFKMGEPYFKIKGLLQYHGVTVFSSNYALYADISNRVMTVLEELSCHVLPYSIDEAFLDLTGMPGETLLSHGQEIRHKVGKWTGIQVCVGIAPTKTLAKLANHGAKQYPGTGGVVDLTDRQRQLRLMKLVPVGEVWGVGRRTAEKLGDMGITTALELARANPRTIRQRFSVVLERTVAELNGQPCLELDEVPSPRQQIISSRSFGTPVTELAQMRQAICEYMSIAAARLRSETQVARQVSVFIRTSAFNPDQPHYSNQLSTSMAVPSADTRVLVSHAIQLLQKIWRDGYRYAKGGVMLADLSPAGAVQADLFAATPSTKSIELMQTIDAINNSGLGKIFLAGQGIRKEWAMKQQFLSPCYTTRWEDIPVVT